MADHQDYIQQMKTSVDGVSAGGASGRGGSSDSDIRQTAHFKPTQMRNINSQTSSNEGIQNTPINKFRPLSSDQNRNGSDLDQSSNLDNLADSFSARIYPPTLNQSTGDPSRNINSQQFQPKNATQAIPQFGNLGHGQGYAQREQLINSSSLQNPQKLVKLNSQSQKHNFTKGKQFHQGSSSQNLGKVQISKMQPERNVSIIQNNNNSNVEKSDFSGSDAHENDDNNENNLHQNHHHNTNGTLVASNNIVQQSQNYQQVGSNPNLNNLTYINSQNHEQHVHNRSIPQNKINQQHQSNIQRVQLINQNQSLVQPQKLKNIPTSVSPTNQSQQFIPQQQQQISKSIPQPQSPPQSNHSIQQINQQTRSRMISPPPLPLNQQNTPINIRHANSPTNNANNNRYFQSHNNNAISPNSKSIPQNIIISQSRVTNTNAPQQPNIFHNSNQNSQSIITTVRNQGHHPGSQTLIMNNRQSRIISNPNQDSNLRSGRSISHQSNNSKQKYHVTFSYSGRSIPAPISPNHVVVPTQQVQVIKTNTVTVIQKTTVIWQHRYLQTIHRLNTFYEKYTLITSQLSHITHILQSNPNNVQLAQKYASLLHLLQVNKREMQQFRNENRKYENELEQSDQLEQQILYKQKYEQVIKQNQQLHQNVKHLQHSIQLLENDKHNLQAVIAQITHTQNNKIDHSQGQTQINVQTTSQIQILQQKLLKSQTFNTQLQNYIQNLENGHNQLLKELQLHKSSQNNNLSPEHIELIRNQQLIISELQNKLQNVTQSYNQLTDQYHSNQEEYNQVINNHINSISQLQGQLSIYANENSGSSAHTNELYNQINGLKIEMNRLQNALQKSQQRSILLQRQLIQKNNEIMHIETEYRQKYNQYINTNTNNSHNNVHNNSHNNSHNNNKQIQELVQENDRLSNEIRRKQQQRRKYEQQSVEQLQNLKRKLMQKQSEIRLGNDRIEVIEIENRKRLAEKQNKIHQLQLDIDTLNNKLKSSHNISLNNNFEASTSNFAEIRSYKDRIAQKDQEISDIQRQKQNADKRYNTLLANFNQIDEQNSTKNQQVQTLKRQLANISSLESEIKTLTASLTKKNQEIIQLKSVTFEVNELKLQLETMRSQKNVLKTSIASKNTQLQTTRQTVNELQSKLREIKLKQSLYPNTNESVADQLQLMYDSNKKKQAEMNKIKQTNQLLETNVQQLEYELERTKSKLASFQKNYNIEKDDFIQRNSTYQGRIKELELKIKGSQDIQKQIKHNFEQQLLNLQSAMKQKEDAIRKIESENKVLKNKLKNHDSKVQEVDQEREALNQKIKQLQQLRQNLKMQISSLQQASLNNSNKQFQSAQLKIIDMESEFKIKDSKIKQLQNIIETLKIKANHNTNPQSQQDFINQQQIEVLRKKIAEYQSRIYNEAFNKNNSFRMKDYESSHVFQQKIIYDLKNQNERLKSMLSGKHTGDQKGSNNKDVSTLQKRLLDFNQRLEEMIEENRILENQNTNFQHILGPKSQYNQELLKSFERQRVALIRKHRTQISAIQSRMVDLQRYCSSLQSFHQTSIYNTTITNKNINHESKGVYSQQLVYYKQKNKELENRIDNHIQLNKQLKQKLENIQKTGDVSLIEYYKNQIISFEKDIAVYLNKIKQLTEQNQNLQNELENNNNNSNAEQRITQLQNTIHQLNRKISQLQMQNNILQTDLNRYSQDIKSSSDELLRYKTSNYQNEQKIVSLQSYIRESNVKIQNYESQISMLQSRIKQLQRELSNMVNTVNTLKSQQSWQTSKLKQRLSQLQRQLQQKQMREEEWNNSKSVYEKTINTLNSRISNLESEIQRLTSLFDGINKKQKGIYFRVKENESQSMDLQNKYNYERNRVIELQNMIRNKQQELFELNEQLERMQLFLQFRKRQSQNSKSQSSHNQAYIQELEEKIRVLNQTVNRYQSELQICNTTIQNLQATLSSNQQLLHEYQQQITVLQQQIQHYVTIFESLQFYIELIRSILLEIQVLAGEINVGGNEGNLRQRQVIQRMRVSVENGVKVCKELFEMI